MSAYNPSIPVDNSLIVAEELRDQFNSLKAMCDSLAGQCDALLLSRASMPSAVLELTQSISNPPTQAQVQNIQNKFNELLEALTLTPV